MAKRVDKPAMPVLVLAALLVIAISYIAYGKWQDYKQAQATTYLKQGYELGIRDALVSIYSQTESCQPAAIYIGNNTKQLVDVRCIQASK